MGLCASSKTAEDANPPAPPPAKPVPAPVVPPPAAQAVTPAPAAAVEKTIPTGVMAKIYIIFYSCHGHIWQMAQAIKQGIDSVEGCEGVLYQVAETLSQEVLEKMHAAPKPDVPVIDPHDLTKADGFVFGFPTRFGMMCAQMKAFWDATGGHWQSGALVGKPVTFFTSTATQGGGQETTIMTAVTQSSHHGMIYIPPGYSAPQLMMDVDNVRGGSPWGAGTIAGPMGARQPSDNEKDQAINQGKYFAGKVLKLIA